MRNIFIEELISAAEENPSIRLIVGDLGYGVIESFRERFPNQFINAGVAEQNMMGMAAGMASEGLHVFVYSIANFPTFRCAEQIRNDVAYHKLPVTIVSVGGGVGYGALGYSHHAIQDFSLIRSFPEMLIASPTDEGDTRACVRYLVSNPRPSYLRLSKGGTRIGQRNCSDIVPGRWVQKKVGKKKERAFLATGGTLALALAASTDNDFVFSLPLWGPTTQESQPNQICEFSEVISVEDHLVSGGFGSWLLESVRHSPSLMPRIRLEALSDSICGLVGSEENLFLRAGLSIERLRRGLSSQVKL